MTRRSVKQGEFYELEVDYRLQQSSAYNDDFSATQK